MSDLLTYMRIAAPIAWFCFSIVFIRIQVMNKERGYHDY